MILLIDNYDSFTFNINDYLLQLGVQVSVFKNDQITISQIEALNPSKLVISPGPCGPEKSGICPNTVKWAIKNDIPTLGICLGMQIIASVFGYKIIKAPIPIHGKTSIIKNNQERLFKETPKTFSVTRYHSLVVEDSDDIENDFFIDARSQCDNQIMAISHKSLKLYGLQYHPESILSEYGLKQISNFLDI